MLWDGILVNTCVEDGNGVGGSYSNPWQYIKDAGKFTITDNSGEMELNDIRVTVKYGDEILDLYSKQGVAPHKICVPLDLERGIDIRWPMERVEIKDAYTGFTKYVKNEDAPATYNQDENSSEETHDHGTGYYNEERKNGCRFDNINADNVYKKSVNYTPRNLSTDDGKYLINETKSEEVENGTYTIPGNGYTPGNPVLVRRRN